MSLQIPLERIFTIAIQSSTDVRLCVRVRPFEMNVTVFFRRAFHDAARFLTWIAALVCVDKFLMLGTIFFLGEYSRAALHLTWIGFLGGRINLTQSRFGLRKP
jgi:hypothetical protein